TKWSVRQSWQRYTSPPSARVRHWRMHCTARRCEGSSRWPNFRSYAGQCRRNTAAKEIKWPKGLRLQRLIEGVERGLRARLADGRQMRVNDGGVQRLVAEILADLAQRNAFFQQMGGVTVTEAVGGGGRVDAAGGAGQAVSHLHGADAHGGGGTGHGLAQRKRAVGPAPARRGKQELRVAMRAPPVAQFGDHRRGGGHVTILAALAVADVQARRGGLAVDVTDFDGHGFTYAQAAVIHQPERGAEARLAQSARKGLHLLAGQHDGQVLRLGDAQLFEHSPTLDLDAVFVEAAQSELGRFHGAVLVMFVLAQEQEVLANLALGERGRVALEMLGQLADVADVLLFGGRPIIF